MNHNITLGWCASGSWLESSTLQPLVLEGRGDLNYVLSTLGGQNFNGEPTFSCKALSNSILSYYLRMW